MELGFSDTLRVEFEAAVVTPVAADVVRTRPYRIGWLIKSVDVNSASIRYRCFHFARVLAPRFESVYFTSTEDLQREIPRLDAVIVVKRIDKTLPSLVAKARQFDVPLYLDLCDDIIAPTYLKNEFGVNLIRFLGIAPALAGVTVPSAEMADRIRGYVVGNGVAEIPIHVIPDIAETWETYRATHKSVTGRSVPARLPPVFAPDAPRRKRVVWFGNYGASHSNFGIFTLRPALKSFRAVNAEIPLELVIISNSEAIYRALVHDCGFPTTYIPWSAPAVYSALASADAALLTTGDDEFCEIKSSSRVLQAFAAGVPVITAKGPAVAEFDEAIAIGRMQDALRSCLGPGRERFVTPKLEAARRVLERYSAERLGNVWATILLSAIAKRRERRAAVGRTKVLIVLEAGDDLETARSLLRSARDLRDLDYVLLVSTQLVESEPRFSRVLRMSRHFPRFYSGSLQGARNLLVDCAAVVVQRPEAPVARLLGTHAAQLGVPVLRSAESACGALEAFIPRENADGVVTSAIKAGPYEEHLNPDGTLDWAFIVNEKARGWILDAICREIGSRQPASWQVSYYPDPTPAAKNYFFSHHALFETFVDREAERLDGAKVFVWYTHPRVETPASVEKLLIAFDDHVTKVIFACESNRQIWIERGLPEEKTAVVLGAADPRLFHSHQRGSGQVGLSSSFYERKNPDRLLEVMKLLPPRAFLVLGLRWNQYALFEQMKALPNFTYQSAPYRDYPDIYATFDVFLSTSNLEGGPIPLVEAMMSNSVPVASRTGFAPDLIQHGRNGFIFDLDASAETIANLIEDAFHLPGDIRQTVEHLSWDNFSASIVGLADD
jgi:glycosyltransferase involved in cell wall biosynthesis